MGAGGAENAVIVDMAALLSVDPKELQDTLLFKTVEFDFAKSEDLTA